MGITTSTLGDEIPQQSVQDLDQQTPKEHSSRDVVSVAEVHDVTQLGTSTGLPVNPNKESRVLRDNVNKDELSGFGYSHSEHMMHVLNSNFHIKDLKPQRSKRYNCRFGHYRQYRPR